MRSLWQEEFRGAKRAANAKRSELEGGPDRSSARAGGGLRSNLPKRSLYGLGVVVFALFLSNTAFAESGKLNLHLDVALASPVAGPLQADGDNVTYGGLIWFSGDYQIASPFALELIVGGGFFGDPYPNHLSRNGTPYITVAAGARLRFLDNREGYLNEEGGDILGNLWVSAHLGYHLMDESQFGIDLGVGYEASIAKPIQLGVFLRGGILFGGEWDSEVDAFIALGINGSIELLGRTAALDSDGDGLSDEREINEHRTLAGNPDTDGDGLNDGLEVNTNTDPRNPDTDGDNLEDGREDANSNGEVDGTESDPRQPDTDSGGVPDGFEVQNGTNPRNADDDDEDGDTVLNDTDRCPGTAPGTEVDVRGCAVIRARMVLPGINFAFDSAEILPESERTLNIARQILTDNAEARVEIGGHTDNQGSRSHNMRLSRQRAQSVRDWLVAHGIDQGRMETRGYGPDRPVGSNDDEAGQAQNRRIEFKQLDVD